MAACEVYRQPTSDLRDIYARAPVNQILHQLQVSFLGCHVHRGKAAWREGVRSLPTFHQSMQDVQMPVPAGDVNVQVALLTSTFSSGTEYVRAYSRLTLANAASSIAGT
eukprot:CAMPEP_0179140790 /NCGR_PEP_ID=MMETSP0796-20121207/67454_1 /TAXON_ID=73915 /ORGANISM="Pyrodinium bahamense, Strain pbaha01" /LENGTH=108 /DNA_ID=CAMNT_0020840397 /DNA_START=244 /DNA_END=568 /DNA_ORIENTATION=+